MFFLGKHWKETLGIRAFAWMKIPLLGFSQPTLVDIDDERIEVKVPLTWRTRNHLKSMYFGALAVGADTAIGLLAMRRIQKSGKRVDLIFKDFHADYKRRAEGDVHFICEDGRAIAALVDEALASSERVERKVPARAVVPSINPSEVVAEFALTLSLKKRG